MAIASGRLAYFGIAKQTVFGTAVAPTTFPRWLDGSLMDVDVKFDEINEGDGSADYSLVVKTKQMWKGKIVGYLRKVELGIFLQAAFGASSDTVTGAGPYTHAFAPTNTPSYYTIEYAMNDTAVAAGDSVIVRVKDCIATNIEFEAEANKFVKVTIEFVGRSATLQGSRATVTLETGNPYRFVNGVFTIDASDQSANVSKFKISMNRNVDDEIMTNSITPKDFIWTYRKIMVEYELIFTTNAHYRNVFFGSGSGTTDSPTNGTGSISFLLYVNGDTGDANTLTLAVPSLVYQGKGQAPKLDGKVFRQEMVALAVRPGSGGIVTASLLNTQAAAY